MIGKVPESLRGQSAVPTSELQDAYLDLRQFLSLRTREELLLDSDKNVTPATQLDNDHARHALGITTLLSPDGAFYTRDLVGSLDEPGIIKEINLVPRNDKSGDINVYGPVKTEFGDTLFKTFGINPENFKLSTAGTATALSEARDAAGITTARADLLIQRNNKTLEISEIQASDDPDRNAKLKKAYEEYAAITSQLNPVLKEYRATEDRITAALKAGPAASNAILLSDINKDNKVPSRDNVHVALYRHASRYLDPASTSSDYCNVFFNAIDSINMSLCVPYFRMNIIDRFAKKKGKYSKLSLVSFLKQTQETAGDQIFYGAEPVTDKMSSKVKKKIESGKIVGMDAFFAPQTLLPDPTDILSNPRRLDTSVPLLSLNSFSIGIETVGIALLSKKTADLSITLHDRSRLTEISPLVSVGNFSSLYFEIEWGWMHPHGDAFFDNPVGRYLNNLRYREIFSPTSYNMTMGEGGAMNISIRLIGGASLDAVNGSILNGGFLTRSFASQMLDKLIKADIQVDDEEATKEIRTLTKVLIDKSRTANMIDRSFMEEIWKYSDNNESSDEDRSQLIKRLQALLEQKNYYKNEEVFDIIKKNMPNVQSYTPSSQIFDSLKAKYGDQIDAKEFTSIGTLLAILVGMPLASTGLYSEVQLHTFKFNDAAGAMAGKQICDAPARIDDVFRRPDQNGSLASNTSISNALGLIANYLSNPKQPLYKIASQAEYSKIKVGVPVKEQKDPDTAPTDKAREQAETFEIPDDFVTPNIRYIIRAVPAKEYSGDSEKKTIADYDINSEKTIAQIIIYDANSSPNFDKVIGAYSYTKLKGKDGEIITPDFAKSVFKKSFPSIVYGATNSVIKGINVSTDINNAISQQNIIDIGKDYYLGRSKSDVSTDVSEISLFPGSVTISMIGLPIIERGQEVYVDLGTGTTLDALYYVTSVKHDFRPGEFTTNLTLTYKGQGSVMSLKTMLEQFNKTLKPEQKAGPNTAPRENAATRGKPPSRKQAFDAT